jgi:hypothetical protein
MAAFSPFLRFLKWKMENGKWIYHPRVIAKELWRGSPSGPSEESADPTLPTSGLLAPAWSLPGSTSGFLVIRPKSLASSKTASNF